MKQSPFDPTILDAIFKFDPDRQERLASRESGRLEFKEAFNLGNAEDYAKTMAAFANTAGGYLVFGVKDSPRTIIGLKTDNFETLDPARVTVTLNDRLAPEIHWDMHVHTVKEKKVGIIYVHEAAHKPVVCLKSSKELQESAIYYRYRGRSERIRYPELRQLLDAELSRERDLWMKHLEKMARIGIENVGVMDTTTGEISGGYGSFIISEDLLSQIQFINSGKFVDNGGEPTLKVIGDVTPVGAKFVQPTKIQSIHGPDLLNAFLRRQRVLNPLDYVKQICYESSAFFPVYFFVGQTRLTIAQVVKEIEKVTSRNQSKSRLLNRLQLDEHFTYGQLGGTKEAGKRREIVYEKILSKTFKAEDVGADPNSFFQALTHLTEADDEIEYVSELLLNGAMPRYTTMDPNHVSTMRRAICHLDKIWYKESVQGSRSGKTLGAATDKGPMKTI